MLLGWDQARPPDVPQYVAIDVTGVNSVTARIQEPMEGPIATKFKGTFFFFFYLFSIKGLKKF